jgi:hypothetical protein
MQRATRSNLVLLGIVAALGIAAYVQIGKETSRFEPPLSTLDPDLIQHVTVSCLQCEPRRFERIGAHWMMREPYDLPADDLQVARLLGIATAVVRSRRPLSSLDAKKIGLNPALMRLDLDDEHFEIGTTDAFNGDRYVRVGETIAMAPDRFSPFLVAAPASELDRHLVPRDSILTGLRIDGIEHPQLLEVWSGALASRITTPTDRPSASPVSSVDLLFADGSLIHYQLIRDGDALIAKRDEPALDYSLPATQAAELLGTAAATGRQ